MTRHVGTYQRIGLMLSADLARRLENSAWRASSPASPISPGEFAVAAIRKAVIASEDGEPFDINEGTNT